ncbi:MAG TPA: bifunctional diguanylate cyclase/phosphodiesterase [Steroidobacteraceae bacterium]|nr:bifunctional diguanylate cyclase/phosphodiesterase [Steroidobacteraceae bacterium]
MLSTYDPWLLPVTIGLAVLVSFTSLALSRRLRAMNARLNYQATHDALTALPNRSLFIERLKLAMEQSQATNSLLAVMLVDLDRFRTVNDSLGHTFGDAVLREVARNLEDSIGARGIAARLHGDEFLLFAQFDDIKEVTGVASTIVERVSKTYTIASVELYLAASIGITTYPFDNSAPEVLISHADEAMHGIKQNGGHGFRFFVPGTPPLTIDRLQLEADLRRAADLAQLTLHYQPLVDIADGRIRGLEALVRWRHPSRGWVPTTEFIPLAEASDIILTIGRWVLDEACRQARRWRDQGFADVSVAVNLSARQFRQSDLLATVQRAVAANGLEPHQLVIELTESVVMSEGDGSIQVLDRLHSAGFQIAVDDFGTGYSSMSYLKRLPVSKLKVDRSFIADLGSNARNDSIVKAVIALAHGLGMTVVGEGVETSAQLACLRAFGCDQYQGYLCSRPRTAADIFELLRRDPRLARDPAETPWLLESVR